MDLRPGRPLARHEVTELLSEARARTFLLVAPLDDEDLTLQHDPLMSPILWDLGHIGHFEEVWLVEKLMGDGEGGEGLRGIYNPFEHPRATRSALPLPTPDEAVRYLGEVRARALEALEATDGANGGRLLRDGFVYRLVLQHEYQHNETILQTLQLKHGRPYPARRVLGEIRTDPDAAAPPPMVRFPGGTVRIGTDDRSEAYDNERPAHDVELAPFWIDTTPVTCARYIEFIEDGGYRDRTHWSDAGWAWRSETGCEAPGYWFREGDAWRTRSMDRVRDVHADHPVVHVCFHEAEAFARWAGGRLPTEQEWEAAALWDPERRAAGRYPWGDEPPSGLSANLDALRFDTTPVGAHADHASPIGCRDMIGNVWEWTSSDFQPYPGYETFPYAEYSEVFFGSDYKVLRGGSWATRPGAIRGTFRNWDYPIRRQIFAGFRCARDAS